MSSEAPRPHLVRVPPGARPYQGQRAGVVTRLAAGAVDLLVTVLILALIYGVIAGVVFVAHPSSFKWPSNIGWTVPTIGFVIVVPYLAFSWRATGRTYGDALFGLRVVNFRGNRLNFVKSVLRALICVVFPIGLLWVAISPANRSVADVIMRTSVIYDWLPATDPTHPTPAAIGTTPHPEDVVGDVRRGEPGPAAQASR